MNATTILEWKSVDDIPDKDSDIVVVTDDSFGDVEIYSSRSHKGQRVHFCGLNVLCWAYVNLEEFKNIFKNEHFNQEYINWLHDNALK